MSAKKFKSTPCLNLQIFDEHQVIYIGWVFETQERKKEIKG